MWIDFDFYYVHNFIGLWSLTCKGDGGTGDGGGGSGGGGGDNDDRDCIHNIQGDSFGTGPKKIWISQRLFIRFSSCIYDYIPCFMKSMSVLEEMLEMFATTVQAELNAMPHVWESGLQDILTNRSNFTSNVVFQFLYGAWLVGISFSF